MAIAEQIKENICKLSDEGKNGRQISEIIGLPHGTVTKILRKLRPFRVVKHSVPGHLKKLTSKQYEKIVEILGTGTQKQTELAKQYGVSHQRIEQIARELKLAHEKPQYNYNDEAHLEIIRLWNQQIFSFREIGELVSLSESHVNYFVRKIGLVGPSREFKNAAAFPKALRLREEGKSYADIGLALGLNADTVASWFKKRGLHTNFSKNSF